jgi:aminopeptidase N
MNGSLGRMTAAATAAVVLVSMNGEAATAGPGEVRTADPCPSPAPSTPAPSVAPAQSAAAATSAAAVPTPPTAPMPPTQESQVDADGDGTWPAPPPTGQRLFRRMAVPPPEAAANPAPAPAAPTPDTPPGQSTALDGCDPGTTKPPIKVKPTAGKPGAAGVGDAYFASAGNGGYDVGHYDVALTYAGRGKGTVDATVAVTAKATQHLSRFNLDFRGPKISKVVVNGEPAAFGRKGQELTVTPTASLPAGTTFTAVVTYSGRPGPVRNNSLGTYGWVPTKDGAVVVAEPDGAPTWLPVNDHPSDKATYSYRLTVPSNLQALANGRPGPTTREGKTTTYQWSEESPMAPYLATVAIGRFDVRRGTVGNVPVITAVDPSFKKSAAALQKTTIKAVAWESKVFGPYPFATTGGIVDDPKLDYALETQERPVYAGFAPDDDFIVHELAHQWFGDSVSLKSWPDIWLNEGFATYAEWLWHERGKKDSAKKIFKRYYRQPSRSPIFNPPPGKPGRRDLFSFSVYIRGAMCLQALRGKVGDKAFFQILKTWASTRRGKNATTADFVAHAEKVSHKQLDGLFKAWLYAKGKPKKW